MALKVQSQTDFTIQRYHNAKSPIWQVFYRKEFSGTPFHAPPPYKERKAGASGGYLHPPGSGAEARPVTKDHGAREAQKRCSAAGEKADRNRAKKQDLQESKESRAKLIDRSRKKGHFVDCKKIKTVV
ncbi:MAG: hypothetical protein SPG32_11590 [Candidatus Ventricola sp.]|nr:hypothetical protein [Candidatus Ventricola sp.]